MCVTTWSEGDFVSEAHINDSFFYSHINDSLHPYMPMQIISVCEMGLQSFSSTSFCLGPYFAPPLVKCLCRGRR